MFENLVNGVEQCSLSNYYLNVFGFQNSLFWTIYLGGFKHVKQFIFWPIYQAVFRKREILRFRPTLDHFANSKQRVFIENMTLSDL